MTSRRLHRNGERGSATVEFALTVPLLVTILLFSIFLTEIIRVKLKLQEAARYMTWEMTSHLLTDFGNGDHDQAFNVAMNATIEDAAERYKDLDSVEDNAPSGMVFNFAKPTVTVKNLDVPLINRPFDVGGGGFFQQVMDKVNGGLNTGLGVWGFNTKGRVEAEIQMKVTNKFLGKSFLDQSDGLFNVDQYGGANLASFNMSSKMTMTANGWHLADGADQTVARRSGMAGDHNDDNDPEPGGMWVQVNRMTYAGLKANFMDRIPFGDTLKEWLPIPHFFGTHVVSHNYGLEDRPTRAPGNRDSPRNCNVEQRRSGGYNGLHNMAADDTSMFDGIKGDHPRLLKVDGDEDIQMRCFDTAPFRDTTAYADSLYRKIFQARGENFMGCENAMSDDPTVDRVYNDEHKDKQVCSNTP